MHRRDFLARLRTGLFAVAGGLPAALAWPGGKELDAAGWTARLTTRPQILAGAVKFPSPGTTAQAFYSRPGGDGPYPAVLLVHSLQGLDPHLMDVARHFSQEGFAALAVDLLSRRGGTASFGSSVERCGAIAAISDEDAAASLHAAFDYLSSLRSVRANRIGVAGFGWGGRLSYQLAASNPRLKATAVICGAPQEFALLKPLNCPILTHFLETDAGIFEDTRVDFHAEAVVEAWDTALNFFARHLG